MKFKNKILTSIMVLGLVLGIGANAFAVNQKTNKVSFTLVEGDNNTVTSLYGNVEIGVYAEAELKNKLTTFTINQETGKSEAIDLPVGTYYLPYFSLIKDEGVIKQHYLSNSLFYKIEINENTTEINYPINSGEPTIKSLEEANDRLNIGIEDRLAPGTDAVWIQDTNGWGHSRTMWKYVRGHLWGQPAYIQYQYMPMFCIEPDVGGAVVGDDPANFGHNIVTPNDFSYYHLTPEKVNDLIIAYDLLINQGGCAGVSGHNAYGIMQNLVYEAMGHRQRLITAWQGDHSQSEYNGAGSFPTVASVERKMAEVKRLVESAKKLPSFVSGDSVSFTQDLNGNTLSSGNTYELAIDNNAVLSSYKVVDAGGLTVSTADNKLTVTIPSDFAKETVTLKIAKSIVGNAQKLYIFYPTRGYEDLQDMAVFGGHAGREFTVNLKIATNGKAQLIKTTANPEVTDGNNCYSLNGAEYGVFTSGACLDNQKVATFTTNEAGVSNIVELKQGTYYVKETKAPKGYDLDETVHTINVVSGKTTTINVSDEALLDPVTVMLKKVDADTGQAVPVGDGSLADAHYEVLFYGGEYADGVDPATLGVKPTKQWMIKTDANGNAKLMNEYLVSTYNNSEFYLCDNVPMLPNGTLTIQEKKAPNGYHLDDTKFVMLVRYNNTSGGVSSYNIPIQKEKSVSLKITKVQEFFKDVNLSGVTFKHIKPDGTESFVTTDTNGNIDIKGLVPGTHKICETQTVAGFVVNSDELVFNVEQNGKITVVKAPSFMSYGIDGNGNLNTTIENAVKNIDFQIVKKNENGVLLANAKFGLYSDAGCNDLITELVTNEQGVLNFADYLKANTNTHYYLKELDAPDGYRIPVDLDGSVHVYDICVKRFIPTQGVLEFSIDGKNYDLNTNSNGVSVDGGVENPTIVFDVINYTGTQLPITGANTVLMYSLVGLAIIMVGAIVLTKNAKTSNKH